MRDAPLKASERVDHHVTLALVSIDAQHKAKERFQFLLANILYYYVQNVSKIYRFPLT